MKTYIDNPIFMEIIDEIATQITEMNYGADAYEERKIFEGSYETSFSDEAQDYYNEMYDEYEGLFNNLGVYRSTEDNPKNQADVIKQLWSELQALKRLLIDKHPKVWSEIQNK